MGMIIQLNITLSPVSSISTNLLAMYERKIIPSISIIVFLLKILHILVAFSFLYPLLGDPARWR